MDSEQEMIETLEEGHACDSLSNNVYHSNGAVVAKIFNITGPIFAVQCEDNDP